MDSRASSSGENRSKIFCILVVKIGAKFMQGCKITNSFVQFSNNKFFQIWF